MRAKLFISMVGVIGILAVSVAAFASTLNGSQEKRETKTMETSPPVKATATATEPPEVSTPEPTVEAYRHMTEIMDWDGEDAYLLAKIAMAEAEDQDTEGKALVILVVLNRVWDKNFPDTIHDVIYEKRQFSPVANGRFDRVEPDEDCWRALEMVQIEHWDESQGALYFESKSESTWHQDNLKMLFRHGKHIFYTEKE